MSTRRDDDLEEFRRGDSELSRAYRRASAPQPRAALDRRVLERARAAHARAAASGTGTWAYAASIALALAVMFAVAYAPRRVERTDETPHFLHTAARHPNSPALHFAYPTVAGRAAAGAEVPDPRRWLARIAALREAGRNRDADEEYRRFCTAYPTYAATRGETGAAVR